LTERRLQNMPLTEIYRPRDLQEVIMVKMLLEREQVDYVITNEHLASVLPMFGPVGLAGMRVLVETARAQEMRELLSEELGLGREAQ
jgi:replication-associated recombination protein RarA